MPIAQKTIKLFGKILVPVSIDESNHEKTLYFEISRLVGFFTFIIP